MKFDELFENAGDFSFKSNENTNRNDVSLSKNTINTRIYAYLNNNNIEYKYMMLQDETNRFILSRLYSLFTNFLKLGNGKIDVNILKELEDKIYNASGTSLEDHLRIRYEFYKLDRLDLESNKFSDDINMLINKLKKNIMNLTDKKDLSKVKKTIVILQILTSSNVTFFNSAYELLKDYCNNLSLGFDDKGLVDKDVFEKIKKQ